VRDFVRPSSLQPYMLRFMGWDQALASRAAAPQYPCLIDARHSVGERYGMVNVPTAAWIDEAGNLVRPPESPGATDAFRAMNRQTLEIPRALAADSQLRRRVYVDAVRDWIASGAASRHVLAPDEVRRRMRGVGASDSLAEASFRLGVWLALHGHPEAARRPLDEAVRLRPESWRYRRQKIVLADPALTGQLAATPEFWDAVQALGETDYYPPTQMEGMPPPLRPGAVAPAPTR
jgi:hypothetical protein